ncbi:MAG: hypothetical protein QM628_13585 [Propionicimonas sp.]
MTVAGGAFEGADGPLGMFPTEVPWTPEAGFVVDRPPVQLDNPLARALAKTRPAATQAGVVIDTES